MPTFLADIARVLSGIGEEVMVDVGPASIAHHEEILGHPSPISFN